MRGLVSSPGQALAAVGLFALMGWPGLAPVSATETTAPVDPMGAGQRMYREGLLPSGEPMSATVQGDVPLIPSQVACIACHRRSGFGATEGQTLVPAVNGAWLFKPLEIGRREFYALRGEGPGARPAYTDETLARAIRDGIGADGQPLDPLMPRYALEDDDLVPLVAYLKSLSSAPSAGVTDDTIHFATVVGAGVAPSRRKALVDVLEAYFRDKNANTRQETRRAVYPAMHKEWKYRAYRKWQLHVWDLSGPSETWRAQLDEYHRNQPVFAVISGVGEGTWGPVHAFCEEAEVPCVLPNTDRPVASETDYYSIYFSKGMALEAEVLAKHLTETVPDGPILQVFRAGAGQIAAETLRAALGAGGDARLEDRLIGPDQALPPAFWSELARARPAALVLWLNCADLQGVGALAATADPTRLYLSGTLCQAPARAIPPTLRPRVLLVYPFALPQAWARNLRRLQPWMRARDIALTDPYLQLNAYYAARLVGEALMHIRSNFSRDYFVERIEHSVDRLAAPSAYDHLSLGPDQRFASKGGYLVRFSDQPEGTLTALAWVVP